MFLDDFDPSSERRREAADTQRRRVREAFYHGQAGATPRTEPVLEPVELPLGVPSPTGREIPSATFAPRRRGVYEREADWPDTRAFLVVTEAGESLMDVTVRADAATDRFVHSLWRFLEREDPRPLRVV